MDILEYLERFATKIDRWYINKPVANLADLVKIPIRRFIHTNHIEIIRLSSAFVVVVF